MHTPGQERERERDAPRIALFTHDTFGLGHVRRSLHILGALARRRPDAILLLITGSPAWNVLAGLPEQADCLKIPTLVRMGSKGAAPPHLALPTAQLTRLRTRIVREAVLEFSPEVLVVDNFPLGSRRELRSVLEALSDSGTQCVLGLRDIVDLPETVCSHWAKDGVYSALESLYDRILVYGSRDVLDAGEAYGLSERIRERVRYCGYVTGSDLPRSEVARPGANREPSQPTILVTVGGGGDGTPLVESFLAALTWLPGVRARVVTGPLMGRDDRARIQRLAATYTDVEVFEFLADLPAHMARADLVVSMAGYNTVAEILATGSRALLVPRTWRYGEHRRGADAGVEHEQLLRAQALAKAGRVRMLHPDEARPHELASEIRLALADASRCSEATPRPSGLEVVADEILSLLRSSPQEALHAVS